MASSTIFISATDARQNPIRETVVHDEARAIETAVLNAVRNGYFEAVLNDGSPMTSRIAANSAVSSIDTSNNQIYIPNHPFKNGDLVLVSSNDALPAPLAKNTYYSVLYIDKDHIKLAYSPTAATNARPVAVNFSAGVYAVNVTDSGSGYLSQPTVSIDASLYGDNATATATLYPWGSIDNVLVITPGQGYTAPPDVVIDSQGNGALAGEVTFKVVGVSVADSGSNYRVGDVLTVVGGSGSVATATVSAVATDGLVTAVTLGLPGSYSDLPTLSAVDTSVQPSGGSGCTLNLVMGIESIEVASGGVGYTAAPRVIIESTSGVNAAANAIVNAGRIVGFNITNAGSGYTDQPMITVTSGSGATAMAVLKPTGIGKITVVDDGGNSYVEPPQVEIIPSGSGAVSGTVTMLITGATIVSSGRSYQSGDVLLIAGGAGTSNASILVNKVGGFGEIISYSLVTSGSYTALPYLISNLVLGGNGTSAAFDLRAGLESVELVSGGSDYTSPPTVVIEPVDGNGKDASAVTMLTADSVSRIVVNASGSGYTAVPNIYVTSGDLATAQAVLAGTSISEITVTDQGSGYTSASIRIIGDGVGAVATANISNGFIFSITVVEQGSGYTYAPTIVIEGNGNNAAAVAAITPTGIAKINVTSAGSNFTSAPTVSIAGSATAVASLVPTVVSRVELIEQGQNYSSQPQVSFVNNVFQEGNTIPPTATAVIGYGVAAINVISSGSGYNSVPSVRISAPQGLNAVRATAEAVVGAGLVGGSTVISLYPPSIDYWKVWKNQTPSDPIYVRPYTDRMDTVINYFVSLGYTINRQTNPATGNTIQWSVMW